MIRLGQLSANRNAPSTGGDSAIRGGLSSKEVNALRKLGKVERNKLDEAYALSLELIAMPRADNWDRAAHAWCLIDLLKRHATEADQDPGKMAEYILLLNAFKVPPEDVLLAEHRERALSLGQADRRAALEARNLSKQGRHEEAAAIYASLDAQGTLQPEDRISWGWEIYRLIKVELPSSDSDDLSPSAIQRIRRLLNAYLKLGLEEPELLRSLILQQALRLAKGEQLKVLPFIRLWDLNLLSSDDFTSQIGKDGKSYPSLAERTIQSAASEAVDGDRADDLRYILPHVEAAIKRFPDNIWLKLNMAKLLRGLGQIDEARSLAVDFAREMATQYWAWDLVGDLVTDDPGLRLSCYAKALICSQDDNFVGKVRLKFASLLFDRHPGEARYEVERVVAHKTREGHRIPGEAQSLSESGWFSANIARPTGREFYARFSEGAEALLFSHLPWTAASLGDAFTVEGKEGQKPRRRRRIYVEAAPYAQEYSVSDAHPEIRGFPDGAPLQVQHEVSKTDLGRAVIHRIKPRPDGKPFDAAPERIGVIDHINVQKSLIHIVVARDVDGTCPISAFPGEAKVGAAVAVRLAQHHGRSGARIRIVGLSPSDQAPSKDIFRVFREPTRVSEGGLGFTSTDIFIPPHIVSSAGIAAGDLVEGTAIISYDKRRSRWGMKAIEAFTVSTAI